MNRAELRRLTCDPWEISNHASAWWAERVQELLDELGGVQEHPGPIAKRLDRLETTCVELRGFISANVRVMADQAESIRKLEAALDGGLDKLEGQVALAFMDKLKDDTSPSD